MKGCRYVLCAFLLLLGSSVASQAADLPSDLEIQASTEATALPAETAVSPGSQPSLDAIFLFEEALGTRTEAATCSGTWKWRCNGTDCGGYGRGQRQCCVGSSCGPWENTPICC